jgi:hypothetical protein
MSTEEPGLIAPSASRCSTKLTHEWLRQAGFEQMFDGSIWWHHRNVPFVVVRYYISSPRLCVGASGVGWHIIPGEATASKILELCAAMGCTLDS